MVETPEDEATQDEQEEGEETIEETEDSSFLDDEVTQDEQEEGEETIEEVEDSSSLDDEVTQDEQEEGEETIEEVEDSSSLDDEAIQDEQEEGEETVEEAEDSSSLDDEATQDEQEEGEETVEEADSSSLNDEAIQDEQEEGEETVEEVDSSSLLASFAADLEFLHGDNMSFYQANKAYYEDQNYEEAIVEFQAAIEYEKAHPSDHPDSEDQAESMSSDEVIAKSMYWIGESYIKLNQKDQAVKTFRQLTDRYSLHYLAPAAQRRIASLRLDEESESA